ncbi:MAG: 6,7-dimethyl-8-ribityllumazine synthase [Lysobacterales bacterium]
MKIDAVAAVAPHPLSSQVVNVAETAPAPACVAIVASRYNAEILESLIGGAIDELVNAGVPSSGIHLLRVPGAFEIPQAVNGVLQALPQCGAVVTLGCVIRGETPHFEYVCQTCADGVADIARHQSVPVTLGVLTADTLEQAQARSSDDNHNKGREAARSALQLAAVLANLKGA